MHKTKSSRGFAHLGLVIGIVIVVAAIAFGGWYVWDKNKDDDKKQSSDNSSQTNNSQSQDDEPSDPSEGGKYLVIAEWGVRFELPEELRGDVEYGIFTFKNGDQAAYFTSKKLVSKSTYTTCQLVPSADSTGEGIFGGTIAVIRTKDKVDNDSFRDSTEGYWYTTEAGNGGACYEGDTGEEKGEFNSQLNVAVRKLQSVE